MEECRQRIIQEVPGRQPCESSETGLEITNRAENGMTVNGQKERAHKQSVLRNCIKITPGGLQE